MFFVTKLSAASYLGMLLHPTVSGLCAMLQTIYETESCFSSASTDSHHQPLELLSDNRGSSTAMPTAGESSLGKERWGGGLLCAGGFMRLQTKCWDPNEKKNVVCNVWYLCCVFVSKVFNIFILYFGIPQKLLVVIVV